MLAWKDKEDSLLDIFKNFWPMNAGKLSQFSPFLVKMHSNNVQLTEMFEYLHAVFINTDRIHGVLHARKLGRD